MYAEKIRPARSLTTEIDPLTVPCLVCFCLSLWPSWSVTVGRRGIGVKKLFRTRFVSYENYREILLDDTGKSVKLKIKMARGGLRIVPLPQNPQELVDHVRTLAARDSVGAADS